MSAQNQKDSDFGVEVVRVLRSERIDDKNRIDLRVVQWKRSPSPTLEKRRIWEREDGDRPTKQVGLNVSDVRYVYENYAQIVNLL